MLIVFCGIISIFLLLFNWSFIPYPPEPTKYNPIICYSPNHEFYIKRYQTVVDAIQDQGIYAAGTAVVYDKGGRRIYKGKTDFFSYPLWSSTRHATVSMGGANYNWYADLPYLPVNNIGDYVEGCF